MKKSIKKVVSILLAVTFVLTLTFVSVSVSAANYNIGVELESKNVMAGETFDIAVSINSNPGIALMRLYIKYDTNYLTLIGANDAGALGSYQFGDVYSSPYVMLWSNGAATENYTVTGTIATLTFVANSNITSDVNTIVEVYTKSANDILNTNLDLDKISLVAVNSTVSIAAENTVVGVTGINVTPENKVLTSIGEKFTVNAEVLPLAATNKTVTFSSNNNAVATVNSVTGVVTAVSEGVAIITAKTQDGNYTDTCEVLVELPHIHSLREIPEVSPTCYKTGVAGHYKCSGCGSLFADATATQSVTSAQLVLEKIAHTPGDTYDCDGNNHWKNCIVCGVAVNTSTHSYGSDNVCDACDYVLIPSDNSITFNGKTLSLASDISVNFYVAKSVIDQAGYSDPYVVFEFNDEVYTVTNYTEDSVEYKFTFKNIAPNQLGDVITAQVFAMKNGEAHGGEIIEYSVLQYCKSRLSKSSDATLKKLVIDLLNYGAAAQIYTDYKTDELVNAFLTEAQLSMGTVEDVVPKNHYRLYNDVASPSASWTAVGLQLTDSVVLRLKLSAANVNNLSVKFETDDGQSWIVPSSKFVATDGGYYVYFKELNADQMSTPVYASIYNGDQQVGATLRYSVETYVYYEKSNADAKLVNLIKAMLKYGNTTYDYANR